ncbi:MAG: dTDP-4-dehydrorhamnose reductase [Myxococcales bacterium]|nr:dTDP-4-dehydrorhamnose reductase [Myxococcales bacterium]
MLGRAMVAALVNAGSDVRASTRAGAGPDAFDHGIIGPSVDLAVRDTVERIADFDVVINCAAYADVDRAEDDEASAFAVNGVGVGWLAERCARIDAKLVHFSTDYVFDGRATAPYAVEHPILPVNVYGRSKADGECRIRACDVPHLIVRTSWLYAPWGKNFVRTMAALGRERAELRVVHDQRGRPTSVEALAAGTVRLLGAGASGTLHLTDSGEATWFELASHVVRRVNPACRVLPCTSAEFPRPAPRPGYSVLDISRSEALLGAPCSWQDAVDDVVSRLARSDGA